MAHTPPFRSDSESVGNLTLLPYATVPAVGGSSLQGLAQVNLERESPGWLTDAHDKSARLLFSVISTAAVIFAYYCQASVEVLAPQSQARRLCHERECSRLACPLSTFTAMLLLKNLVIALLESAERASAIARELRYGSGIFDSIVEEKAEGKGICCCWQCKSSDCVSTARLANIKLLKIVK